MRKYFLLALGLLSFAAIGQDRLEVVDIDEINNSIALKAEAQEFQGVLDVLRKVNKNDSTYASLLVRKSYYLMALDRFEEARETLDEGLALNAGDLNSTFYQNKGVLFTRQEKFDEAIAIFDEGLEIFPANHLLLYNKAVALQGNGQLKEAVEILEHVIALNPLYSRAYIQLGSIYHSQERPAQALMAFDLGLLLEPDGEASFSRLHTINTMFSSKNENKRTPGLILSEDDKSFEDIDLIISNQIALSNNYKIANNLDFALTKQNHALLIKLEDYKGNDGFWSKKVVPFFQWIQDSKNFDSFTYTISYSIENDDYKKIVEKKNKEIQEFLKIALITWKDILETDNKEPFSDRNVQYIYNSSSFIVSGMGPIEDDKPVGEWFYFNKEGRLETEAHYDKNGERTGNWKWYHDNLKIKELASFKDGNLHGENTMFHRNGQLWIKGFYKDGELTGEFLLYNANGALEQKKHFEEGKLNGTFTSYFNVGEEIPEFVIPYKEDKVQDKVTEYFSNGNLYSTIPFKDGNRHGIQKIYHLNGNVKSEIAYVDNKIHGDYKTYFLDGNISEQGTYKYDLLNGPYTTHYPDGTLESEAAYLDGSLNGSYTYYDDDGKKHYFYNYKKGDIIDYKFFNKKGEVLKEGKRRGGEFYYNGFAANGNLTSEGLYDVSGGRKGEWKYYGQNGNLLGKGIFENNLTQGIYTGFYPDGVTEWIGNYKNDTLVGYYANYHINGKIENQGGYKNGMQQGEWRFYYIDGSLKSINFYHKGEFHGIQEYYGDDGKLTNTAIYEYDNLLSETFNDHNGNLFQKLDYKPTEKNSLLIFNHYNGNAHTKTSYIHGIKHGAYNSYYFDGKLETEGEYLNGSQHGTWTWYFENGQPSLKATYILGYLDGEFIRYYKNGQIEDSSLYQYGDRVGTGKSYYENGNLFTNTSYFNGKVHGRKEFYGPTGKLQLIRFYNHGILIGYSYNDRDGKEIDMIPIINETAKIISYYDNGKISRELEYEYGESKGAYKVYYYDGQLKEEFWHENGEYQGAKIYYHANGKIKERKEYLSGELHGKATTYYEDGTLKEEALFKNGVQTGNTTRYNKTEKKTISDDYFDGKIYARETF